MEVRSLNLADLDAVLDLRTRSFGPPLPESDIPGWKAIVEHDAAQFVAVYEGRRLLAVSRYHRFVQYWLGREVPMAGVAGVAVAPEERGRGVGRLMMSAMLDKIAADGYPLSALYPATIPLYRGLGWELAGPQPEVHITAESLRTIEAPTLKLRRAGPEDIAEIREMVGRVHLANRECGPILYPEHLWRHWMRARPPFAYLADDGYLEYHWDGREALFVEFAGALSEQTTRAFWSLVGSTSSIVRTVRVNLAAHDPIWWLTREIAVEIQPSAHWMLRVVDAPRAVAGRGFPLGVTADVVIAVLDPQLPGNAGPWRLSVADGTGCLTPAGPGRDDPVRLRAGGFAALYAGWPMSSLRRAGLADGGTGPADAALDAAFAAQPYCQDYF
ncbi:MAG TPA: GNAT family N-acetyltransferase [Actinomycetes bacterium]|nr:GNAT family N-acetyltransferase [Actinomycetes bacterium]